MTNFNKTRVQAQKRGPAIPIAAKWKNITARLPFLTHVQTWLDWVILETFRDLAKPENKDELMMVP